MSLNTKVRKPIIWLKWYRDGPRSVSPSVYVLYTGDHPFVFQFTP